MSHKLSICLYHCNGPVSQKGAGLPIALFIVTVLSLIVLGMSQLQESSGNAISLQIQSQRAFFAAESGAQVVMADFLKTEADGGSISCSSTYEEIYTADFGEVGLRGCTTTVDCQESDGVLTYRSMGVCGIGKEQATREIEVKLEKDEA